MISRCSTSLWSTGRRWRRFASAMLQRSMDSRACSVVPAVQFWRTWSADMPVKQSRPLSDVGTPTRCHRCTRSLLLSRRATLGLADLVACLPNSRRLGRELFEWDEWRVELGCESRCQSRGSFRALATDDDRDRVNFDPPP
jgi:hypothetical protein